jgi:hypothetical protein
MIKCRSCEEFKDLSEFAYRGGGRKGLQADCNECSRVRARTFRQDTRNKVSEYKLAKGCECCGFVAKHSSQLDLDHIDPETKTYKGAHKAYDAGWSWSRVEQEIAKCTVLCKNCHALRTYEEGHWKNAATTVRMRQSGLDTV